MKNRNGRRGEVLPITLSDRGTFTFEEHAPGSFEADGEDCPSPFD